jgi:hypothetical protein
MPQPEFQLFDPEYFADLPGRLEQSEETADRFLSRMFTPTTLNNDWARSDFKNRNYYRYASQLSDPQNESLLTVTGIALAEARAKGLETITRDSVTPEDPMVILARNTRHWGRQFVAELLKELRKILCNGKAEHLTNAALSGLIAHLAKHFGLPMLTTTGLVFLLLSAIARALRKSFCKTFDRELIDALTGKSK